MLITTACMKLNVFSKFFNNTWSVMFILLHAEKNNSILLINSLQWVNRVSSTTLGTDSWPWFCSSVISSLQTFSRTVLTPICRLSSDITKERFDKLFPRYFFVTLTNSTHGRLREYQKTCTFFFVGAWTSFPRQRILRSYRHKLIVGKSELKRGYCSRGTSFAVVHFFHFDIILSFIKDLSCTLPLSLMGRNVRKLLECFSTECHKTKTKVIRAANQRKGKYPEEPMRTRVNSITEQSKLMQFRITFNTRWKVTLRESAIYCLIYIK